MANFTGTGSVVSGVGTNAIRRAISAYSDQEYTDNVRIAGTALVGSDARISTSDEDYYGTIRWTRTLGDLDGQAIDRQDVQANSFNTAINLATEDSTEGQTTDVRYDSAKYIKTMRTMGAEQYNVTQVLSQAPNAIEKVSRDFGITRARDADAALMAMLRGVALEESRGTNGQLVSSPRNDSNGFYFETGGSNGGNSLVTTGSANNRGAVLGTSLYTAMAAGFGDLEPDFMYLLTDVETFQAIRAANLVDDTPIRDGNVDVQTLLSGKIRLIVSQSLSSHNASGQTNVGSAANKTSYLMLPGALYQHDLSVPNPVAFDADESRGGGAGEREIWYRWGNIYHPRGYSWEGRVDGFVQNQGTFTAADRAAAGGASGVRALVNTSANQFQAWERKETVGNLGILPIFHG